MGTVDEDATAEVYAKTAKYFESIERVQEEVDRYHASLIVKKDPYAGQVPEVQVDGCEPCV